MNSVSACYPHSGHYVSTSHQSCVISTQSGDNFITFSCSLTGRLLLLSLTLEWLPRTVQFYWLCFYCMEVYWIKLLLNLNRCAFTIFTTGDSSTSMVWRWHQSVGNSWHLHPHISSPIIWPSLWIHPLYHTCSKCRSPCLEVIGWSHSAWWTHNSEIGKTQPTLCHQTVLQGGVCALSEKHKPQCGVQTFSLEAGWGNSCSCSDLLSWQRLSNSLGFIGLDWMKWITLTVLS